MAQDDVDHRREKSVQQASHVSRIELFGGRGGSPEIGTEYGHRDNLTIDDGVIDPDGLEWRSRATGSGSSPSRCAPMIFSPPAAAPWIRVEPTSGLRVVQWITGAWVHAMGQGRRLVIPGT